MRKVLAERIEQNLEGMSNQLAKEVVGLEEVQKLQQVHIKLAMTMLRGGWYIWMILVVVQETGKGGIMLAKQQN